MIFKMIRKNEKSIFGKWLTQFAQFGLIGVVNTGLSLAATYLMMAALRPISGLSNTWRLNLATLIGYVAGVLNSYFWNNKYVFKNKQENNASRRIVKVFLCYGATYLLSVLLMDLMVVNLGISEYIAPVLRLVITIPLNFFANKLWAYKDV